MITNDGCHRSCNHYSTHSIFHLHSPRLVCTVHLLQPYGMFTRHFYSYSVSSIQHEQATKGFHISPHQLQHHVTHSTCTTQRLSAKVASKASRRLRPVIRPRMRVDGNMPDSQQPQNTSTTNPTNKLLMIHCLCPFVLTEPF